MNPLSSIRSWLPVVALGATLAGQDVPRAHDLPGRRAEPTAQRQLPVAATPPGQTADRLLFDQPGDGRIWAAGSTFKASFGAEGFVYVPFFGSHAPRNHPVHFVLRAVRVGGRDLALLADVMPSWSGTRVTFDRGSVREVYDLTPTSVEQTFVVDGDQAGDVEVELEVVTDLVEDATTAGLQFGNALGHVDYGTAFLVRDDGKREIPTTFAGRTLRLQVPAVQRGTGPVVIDPVITTRTLTPTLMESDIPDVAYDATTDRWAVVWVHIFSASDHDVVAEVRTGDNEGIAGGYKSIDTTTESFSWPRIANLASADRFLVAMERYRAQNPIGQQYTVWGRTLNAAAPFATGSLLAISPASTSNQNSVDVGGDPGDGTLWTVVWVHGTDIHARQVEASGALRPNTIPIESTSAFCINPQISLSNGNGLTQNPGWCIIYNLQVSSTDWDVYGAFLRPDGVVTRQHRAIASGSSNDFYTYISSPLTDVGPQPRFLISYERQQATTPEMVVKVVDHELTAVAPEVNLTRRYGFSGIYCRVESDGSRFAAVSQIGGRMHVGTLALVHSDLVLHEAPESLGTGASPHLASKRSGGGIGTEYAVAFTGTSYTPDRVLLTRYRGHAPSGGIGWRGTNCGLDIDVFGDAYLGRTLQFTLDNVGTDFAALLLGSSGPLVQLCSGCFLGLDLTQPSIALTAPATLPLPSDPLLVGARFAVQGFAFGSGNCVPAAMRVSNTVDVVIQ